MTDDPTPVGHTTPDALAEGAGFKYPTGRTYDNAESHLSALWGGTVAPAAQVTADRFADLLASGTVTHDAPPTGADMRANIFAAMARIESAPYRPTPPLVLHPFDYAAVKVADVTESDPQLRRDAQAQIADAFGVPHWIAGVDGAPVPFRVRVRRFRHRMRRALRTILCALPGVTDYGHLPRPGTTAAYFHEGSLARHGATWVQVGRIRLGFGWPDDDGDDW